MKKNNEQRKSNIIRNINYLLRSRNITKTSFSDQCGLTRASLYRIIDGTIDNVHYSTINKISNFFGVTCNEIESANLEELEKKRNSQTIDCNVNPLAIPIIPETEFLNSLKKSIGMLVTRYPVTYIFSKYHDIVAMKVTSFLGDLFDPGDILIILRKQVLEDNPLVLYETTNKTLKIRNNADSFDEKKLHYLNEKMIGTIIEERPSIEG